MALVAIAAGMSHSPDHYLQPYSHDFFAVFSP
jgi:hypothetical protein